MCSGFSYERCKGGVIEVWAGARCIGRFVVSDFGTLVRVG